MSSSWCDNQETTERACKRLSESLDDSMHTFHAYIPCMHTAVLPFYMGYRYLVKSFINQLLVMGGVEVVMGKSSRS